MNIKNLITSAATILSLSAFGALAEPALIYDLGGKFDKS
ncbi:MAG: BMP family ABC transporter substrate-binding protein, partial [Rhodobacteraceae bacterium]|nr:BMP family ABC transporter substrate-binding protein [Paracoccaceae bacterium]